MSIVADPRPEINAITPELLATHHACFFGVCGGLSENCPICTLRRDIGWACKAAAFDYLRRGWSPLSLCPVGHFGMTDKHKSLCNNEGKVPWHKWKDLQDKLPTRYEIDSWYRVFFRGVGVALGPVSGIIRLDVDGIAGQRLLETLCGDLPATAEFISGGGGRGLLYRIPPDVILKTTTRRDEGAIGNHQELRYQAKGAQTVMPPTLHASGVQYAWKPGHHPDEIEMQFLPPALVDEMRVKPAAQSNGTSANASETSGSGSTSPARKPRGSTASVERRAVSYLNKMPEAISGKGGHDATMNAARIAVYGFALGIDAGQRLLVEHYNPRCVPPWTEAELRHKCVEADTKPFDKPRGWLVESETSAAKRSARPHRPATPDGDEKPRHEPDFTNYREVEGENDAGEVSVVKIGLSQPSIINLMTAEVGPWPKVAGRMPFVEDADHKPRFLESHTQLFAWLGSRLGKPGKDNAIGWAGGPSMVTQAQYYEACRCDLEQYEAVEPYPHEPAMRGHYYMHPALKDKETGAFTELLNKFKPATPADFDLIASAWMTPFAGIDSGQRPAFLIQSTEDDKHGGRGTGKTTLAELIGRLCGGHIEIRAGDEWDRLVTRLLSPAALTKRIAILDNVKTLKFSWAELESGITADVISGRQLYVGEGRRPNNITYFITLNGANMSKDMSQRCVPIVLARPTYNARWEEDVVGVIETRRWDIISDIVNILRAPGKPLAKFSRWSAWERAVLARVGDPSECQRVIEDRQSIIDEDQTESDIVRAGLIEELKRRGHEPEFDVVWMKSAEAAQILNRIENEHYRPFNKAMTHLYLLSIPEIRKANRKGRGCVWTGQSAEPGRDSTPLKPDFSAEGQR